MSFLKHIVTAGVKSRKVRASAATSLAASAKLPNLELDSVENSQGSSAAVAELSRSLDIALEKFDNDELLSDRLEYQLSKLNEKASSYSNSWIHEEDKQETWNISLEDAQLVSLAWECAAAVYDSHAPEKIPCFEFVTTEHIKPNLVGTVKETTISVVRSTGCDAYTPFLIVAVRGTASCIDAVVNLNGNGKSLEYLLNDGTSELLIGKQHDSVLAHAGFLNGSVALYAMIADYISQQIKRHGIKHLIFAGHSAGGAVASLLFLKYLTQVTAASPGESPVCLSSITFGAPPTVSQELTARILRQDVFSKHVSLLLSIVNEYDLVPRVDTSYTRSLVELYRSIYDYPLASDLTSGTSADVTYTTEAMASPETESLDNSVAKGFIWRLPNPEYWHLGKIVAFKLAHIEEPDDGNTREKWEAVVLSPDSFAKLLFCSVKVHKRSKYAERVKFYQETLSRLNSTDPSLI